MRYLTIALIINLLFAQEYDIKIWGVHFGTAHIYRGTDNDVELTLKIDDIIDNIYPVQINYHANYDGSQYFVKEAHKKVKQGNREYKYSVNYNDGWAVYDKKDSLFLEENVYSFLSLIEKIINAPIATVDTKWFKLENEGVLYMARPLWSDSTNIIIGKKEYFCDHYRLDLRLVDDGGKLFDETDYFNDLFFDINSIRQLWVENWQKQRKLVKIVLKGTLLSLEIVKKD